MRCRFVRGTADDSAVSEQGLPVECDQLPLEAFAVEARGGLQPVDHQDIEQQVAHPCFVGMRVTHERQQRPNDAHPRGEWWDDSRRTPRRSRKERRSALLFTRQVIGSPQRRIGVVDE